MMTLYPEIKPYTSHRLAVDPPHELYIEECGNPDGIPVLFVHGGPGAGCNSRSRCFFDPEHYRIILFDQRGAGRSTPHAELSSNTAQDLVDDIERIRCFLDIERWCLFGGSWGATLSLLYAQAYPLRVSGLILRGVFLCREQDIQWFYQYGASQVFPDYWQDFIRPVAGEDREDFIAAYHQLLTGDNELTRMSAAKSWSLWEARCATLRPNSHLEGHNGATNVALAMARIEAHFFINKGFLEPNQIINNASSLADIPGIIVHGRYDMICPLDNALALHQAWPGSELHIVREAGHAATEPGNVDALVKATREMAALLMSTGNNRGSE
jgi:proline iminopeptidase